MVYSKNVEVAYCLSRLPSMESTEDQVEPQDYVLNINCASQCVKEIMSELQQDTVLYQIIKYWTELKMFSLLH